MTTTKKICKYGNACYQTNFQHTSNFIHPGDSDYPNPLCKFWLAGFCRDGNKCQYSHFCCPCGGGQSCIVDRRKNNDWVHEDNVRKENDLPIRQNCFSKC